jgi:hypothetical protein
MLINIFDLAGYTPNLFEHEPFNIYGSIYMILSEKPENNWKSPIFHAEPEAPKPWVDHYRQSAIHRDLLRIDDSVFNDDWKEYQSWADEWEYCCKTDNKTEWCYCKDTESSAKCSQW